MKKDVLMTMIKSYNDNIIIKESKPNKNGKTQKNRVPKKGYSVYKKELDEQLEDWMQDLKEDFPMVEYDIQIGMPFNLNQNPWIQFYYTKENSSGRRGHYCGISFDNTKKELGIWIGFGETGKKPQQIINEVTDYRQKYKKLIGSELERGFEYNVTFVNAIIISKAIHFDKVISEEVKEDLKYILKYYIKFVEQAKLKETEIMINETKNEKKKFTKSSEIMGRNIIIKGFPGSGKSTMVKERYLYENGKKIDEDRYEIVVFHREYTNADFVGMLKPVEKNMNLVYEFEPGPFSRILKRAIENSDTNFYLVIEEINRGDAAKIFGDIFQLLDRTNGNGRSDFSITNSMISLYVYGEERKIYIPENLSIIATMNVSDENVKSLDTAFERRWEDEWVIDSKGIFDDMYIKGMQNLTWGKFRNVINSKIVSQNGIVKNEDKQLGAYFINSQLVVEDPEDNNSGREKFLNKVIAYLYTNVCKYDKNIIFGEEITSIQKLFNKFLSDNYLEAFNDEIKAELKTKGEDFVE